MSNDNREGVLHDEFTKQRATAKMVMQSVEKLLDDRNVPPAASVPVVLEWSLLMLYAVESMRPREPGMLVNFKQADDLVEALKMEAKKTVLAANKKVTQ